MARKTEGVGTQASEKSAPESSGLRPATGGLYLSPPLPNRQPRPAPPGATGEHMSRRTLSPRERAAVESIARSAGLSAHADLRSLAQICTGSPRAAMRGQNSRHTPSNRQWLHRESRVRYLTWARAQLHQLRRARRCTRADADILIALVGYLQGCGTIDPSYSAIAARAKAARSTAEAAIARLEAAGLIRRTRRWTTLEDLNTGRLVTVQDTNAYALVWPQALDKSNDTDNRSLERDQNKKPGSIAPAAPLSDGLSSALARLGHRIADRLEEKAGADAPKR